MNLQFNNAYSPTKDNSDFALSPEPVSISGSSNRGSKNNNDDNESNSGKSEFSAAWDLLQNASNAIDAEALHAFINEIGLTGPQMFNELDQEDKEDIQKMLKKLPRKKWGKLMNLS